MQTTAVKNADIRQDMHKKFTIKSLIPVLGLVVIFIVFSILTNGDILSESNLKTITNQAFEIMLIAVGAVFVYAHGGIDFSLGALMGLTMLVITVLTLNLPAGVGLLAGIAMGLLSGFILGNINVRLYIPVFIASLCLQYVYRGILTVATARAMINTLPEFTKYNNWTLKIVVLIAVIALGYYLFNYTRYGKYIKAIGGNEDAAHLSGVNVKRYKVIAYMTVGFCVGLSAFFATARTGAVNPNSGSGLEMDVLIALVLGGMPLSGGGDAKIRSAVIGALTIAVLSNGFVLLGVNPNVIEGIKGLVFIVTVFLTFSRRKGQLIV